MCICDYVKNCIGTCKKCVFMWKKGISRWVSKIATKHTAKDNKIITIP